MRKRIVFVNLHTDWMFLRVTDVILFKNGLVWLSIIFYNSCIKQINREG